MNILILEEYHKRTIIFFSINHSIK